jgi:hypothetical protein
MGDIVDWLLLGPFLDDMFLMHLRVSPFKMHHLEYEWVLLILSFHKKKLNPISRTLWELSKSDITLHHGMITSIPLQINFLIVPYYTS